MQLITHTRSIVLVHGVGGMANLTRTAADHQDTVIENLVQGLHPRSRIRSWIYDQIAPSEEYSELKAYLDIQARLLSVAVERTCSEVGSSMLDTEVGT